MRSPINEYRETTDKDKLRKEVYPYFNEKYFKKPYQVLDDLFDTNERVQAQKLRFFLPGRIYTWKYDPLYKDFLDFYDTRPIVLVHSQYVAETTGNMIVQGLNLNFLPELQRAQTMEVFYQIFKADIKGAEQMIEKEQIGVMRNAWQFLTDWYFTIKIYNQQARIGYQWAYRNYIIPRITSPVLIEMEDWHYIPFFVPKEFKGKAPAQIWSEYTSHKSELAKYAADKNRSKEAKKKFTKPGGR